MFLLFLTCALCMIIASPTHTTLNAIAAIPNNLESKPKEIPHPSLSEWTAQCLYHYDEECLPEILKDDTILSAEQFKNILHMYLYKAEKRGIKKEWDNIKPGIKHTSSDFKYPYATIIESHENDKFCFMGDLHGSIHSLLRNIWRLVALGYIDDNFKLCKNNNIDNSNNENLEETIINLVFTGDYTDRGRYGAEVLYTLLRLKCANWDNVHLVRGNHEVISMNKNPVEYGGGFWAELLKKYKFKEADTIFLLIEELYQTMPLSIFITHHQQVIKVTHGAFGPYEYYEKMVDRVYDAIKTGKITNLSKRYISIPLEEQDLVAPGYQWCDIITQDIPRYANKLIPDAQRVWKASINSMLHILHKSNIDVLIRGHQHGSFGLKLAALPEQYVNISQKAIDPGSNLVHWVEIIKAQDPAHGIIDHNKNNGFLIAKYIPIFTFSSSPEGVGQNYDCFGILHMNGLLDSWRLKVYEYPSSFISKNKSIFNLFNVYTTIRSKPIKKEFGTFFSSSDMDDPVFIKFSGNSPQENEQSIDSIKESLENIIYTTNNSKTDKTRAQLQKQRKEPQKSKSEKLHHDENENIQQTEGQVISVQS